MIHYNNNRPFVEGVSLEDIAKAKLPIKANSKYLIIFVWLKLLIISIKLL